MISTWIPGRIEPVTIEAFAVSCRPWSGEPIYRNGQFCGFVTSSAYGFTLGKQVCLGYVHANGSEKITTDYIRGATYEIDIATKRFKARPNLYQPSEMGPTVQLSAT